MPEAAVKLHDKNRLQRVNYEKIENIVLSKFKTAHKKASSGSITDLYHTVQQDVSNVLRDSKRHFQQESGNTGGSLRQYTSF